MRLIDADRLTEMMCESCDTEACYGMGRDSTAKCYSVRQIEEQPTAFDIEEVVKEVQDELYCYDIPIYLLDDIIRKGGVK